MEETTETSLGAVSYWLINKDVLAGLRELADESVNCIVTSPPYWGLRSYGTEAQIWGGSSNCKHTFEEHHTVRKGSTNGRSDLGSTIVSVGAPKTIAPGLDNTVGLTRQYRSDASAFCLGCGAWRGEFGLEPTPQLYVEHMVEVFREARRMLRNDGTLWLNLGDCYATGAGKVGDCPGGGPRGENWQGPTTQPNRMPLPGLKPKDMVGIPWRAAFALQEDGWWLRSDIIWAKANPMPESVRDRPTKAHEYLFLLSKSEKYYYDHEAIKEPASPNSHSRCAKEGRVGKEGANSRFHQDRDPNHPEGRKTRRPGVNPKCAEPGQRIRQNTSFSEAITGGVVEFRNKRSVWTIATEPYPDAHFATFPTALVEPCILAGCPEGGVVLDPFAGSGTTLAVALRNGRNAIGLEMKSEYCEMARRRISKSVPPMFLAL